MATTPQFGATPIVWSGLVPATLDTSMTAPTNATNLGSAGANGTKIDQIIAQATATTVLGIVNVFAHDGTTYHVIDQFLVPIQTSSTTAKAWQSIRNYSALVLPTGWSLRVSNTIAGNQSIIKVTAFGGSL